MERDDVIGRLRALGSHPIDETVAAGHLAAAATVGGLRRWTSIAATCLVVIGVPAAGIAAARAGGGGPHLIPTDQPNDEPGPYTCGGLPSLAAQSVSGDANRALEAAAFVAWRQANCRGDSTSTTTSTTSTPTTSTTTATSTTSTTTIGPTAAASTSPTTTTPTTSSVSSDDDCTGPPPFAGMPATPADPNANVVPSPRADEAATHAERHSGCADETSTSPPPSVTPSGPPENVPGPPETVPAGPPDHVPGPPDGVPGATAAGGQGGQGGHPEGVPAGGTETGLDHGGGQGGGQGG